MLMCWCYRVHTLRACVLRTGVSWRLSLKRRRATLASQDGSGERRVFDRNIKRIQRDRSARQPDVAVYDYLKHEVGWRVADRLFDIKRTFNGVLELGCGRGHVIQHLDSELVSGVSACDMSAHQLAAVTAPQGVTVNTLCEDEQHVQPEANSLQLVVSSLSLHWLNDPQAALYNVMTALQPDCPVVGACLGGDSLHQLRTCLQLADLERRGGLRSHMSPLLRPVDVTTLLTRAGFRMITVDVDQITVRYPSMFELLWDLQGMAESAAPHESQACVGRECLLAAAAIYREMYGDAEAVPATFHVIHFIGWKPSLDQPQPATRGSAQVSLKQLSSIVTAQKPPEN